MSSISSSNGPALKVLVPLASNQGEDKEKNATKAFAYHGYLNKLISRSLLPVLVSHHFTDEMMEELKSDISGVLLMGGSDVNPQLFGQQKHPKSGPFDDKRDAFETSIITWARENKIPLLGICRGSQLLAVATGGKLQQHVPDVSGAAIHSPTGNFLYQESMGKVMHDVHLEAGSKAHLIFSQDTITTNSYHHQSVEKVSDQFKISGRTADGIAEFIEDISPDYFCVGIQSHPEALVPSFGERLFDSFAAAVGGKKNL